MKLLYKSGLYCFLLLLVMVGRVSAQLQLNVRTDNFTTFSTQKTYSDLAKLTALTPIYFRNNPDFGKCVNDSTQWCEEIDKRTLKSRSFVGIGDEIITESSYGNINYVDENGWMRAINIKLRPLANGWSAQQQPVPVYLYNNASTALSLGHNGLMLFNKNVRFNQQNISTANYTVGDNGIYIKDVVPNTDKIIRFGQGRIETDYIVNQPLKLTGNLVISEDIDLPAGFSISENVDASPLNPAGTFEVLSTDGKVVAEFRTPVCYDKKGNMITGSYQFHRQNNGYQLDINVPSTWLNNPALQYPVTIDPVVSGPISSYPNVYVGSCPYPALTDTMSMNVTIPGGITITNFYVQSNLTSYIPKKYGKIYMWTGCSGHDTIVYDGNDKSDTSRNLGGTLYISLTEDIYGTDLTCCYAPSCSNQTLKLNMAIARDTLQSTGCNIDYMFYDPTVGFPYEAYVVGHTVEANNTGVGWTIQTKSLCANSCDFTIRLFGEYGVSPYKIYHPWSKDTLTFGAHSGCFTNGVETMTLTVPNCPWPVCIDSNLSVPPPTVVDTCGNRIPGLPNLSIPILAIPDVKVSPDPETICSGQNVNLSLSSCVKSSKFSWHSSDGSQGSDTIISDALNNNGNSPITVNYTITSSGGGCSGDTTVFPVTVTPFNVVITPADTNICSGESVQLKSSGNPTIYSWSPGTNLSCTSCANPIANPTVTTTYTLTGTNGDSCSAYNTVVINVTSKPIIKVSNDTTIFLSQTAQLHAYSSDSVTWSPSTGLSCTTCSNPKASPLTTTTYIVGIQAGPCIVDTFVTVTVVASLIVPSAFMPNSGNPKNSRLHILPDLTAGITLQVFRVYNRWGQMVFETHDINDGWDGTFNGKAQPMGTYVYYAEATFEGKTTTIKGDVVLVR